MGWEAIGSSAASSAIGSSLDTGGNIAQILISNELNRSNAQRQMNFQERMSDSSHQREVKDLLAAGLNPVLSAMGGSGASTPVGSTYNAQGPDLQAAGKYLSYQVQQQAIKNSNADIAQKNAATRNLGAKTMTEVTQQDANSANAAAALAQKGVNDALVEKIGADASSARMDSILKKVELIKAGAQKGVYDSWFGKNVLPWIQEITGLNPVHFNISK